MHSKRIAAAFAVALGLVLVSLVQLQRQPTALVSSDDPILDVLSYENHLNSKFIRPTRLPSAISTISKLASPDITADLAYGLKAMDAIDSLGVPAALRSNKAQMDDTEVMPPGSSERPDRSHFSSLILDEDTIGEDSNETDTVDEHEPVAAPVAAPVR